MHLPEKIGSVVFFFLGLAPIFLWLPSADFSNSVAVARSLGQITGLVGTALICLDFVLSARVRWLEPFFGGLNRIYILHALLGSIGFSLILLHPSMLVISYALISMELAAGLVIPVNNLPVLWGSVALVLMTVLLILTYYIKLEYDTWKRTHTWLGLALILFCVHVITVSSVLNQNPLLKMYMYGMLGVAIVGFAYKLSSKKLGVNFYKYTVSGINIVSGATLVKLSPGGKQMSYKPGQFVFITPIHRGISQESHPFSLMSDPKKTDLCLGVKSFGDFSESLKLLEKGSTMLVEGPWGRFSYEYAKKQKMVWIGGGIGITPFFGMLVSLRPEDKVDVVFVYSVKEEKEALFLDMMKEYMKDLPNVRFILWVSNVAGRFSIDSLAGSVPDVLEREYFICGPPPMMKAMKDRLQALGVSSDVVHTEEFAMT